MGDTRSLDYSTYDNETCAFGPERWKLGFQCVLSGVAFRILLQGRKSNHRYLHMD